MYSSGCGRLSLEDPLRDIDSIPWSSLEHAFGPADNVPALLMGLLSADEGQRWEALYGLMETVWHQGTIYQATSHVVPFLVKMLQDDRTPDRAKVAFLLAAIADGNSYLEIHAEPATPMEATWRQILAEQGEDLDQKRSDEQRWVINVRKAVNPRLPLLYEFMDHQDPEIRMVIATALGNYPDHAGSSIDHLKTALELEHEQEVRDAITTSLAALQPS